jgi:hypothetical protein
MAEGIVKSDAVQPGYSSESLAAAQKAIAAIRVLRAERKAAAIVEAEVSRQEGIDRLKIKVEKLVNRQMNLEY